MYSSTFNGAPVIKSVWIATIHSITFKWYSCIDTIQQHDTRALFKAPPVERSPPAPEPPVYPRSSVLSFEASSLKQPPSPLSLMTLLWLARAGVTNQSGPECIALSHWKQNRPPTVVFCPHFLFIFAHICPNYLWLNCWHLHFDPKCICIWDDNS